MSWRAFAVLVLVVATLPGAARAQYGSACATSADCTDTGYPHCYVYWKDETNGLNTVSKETRACSRPPPLACVIAGTARRRLSETARRHMAGVVRKPSAQA
jgi:hypothetical protein